MSEAMQPGPLTDSDILSLKEILLKIAVEFVLQGICNALAMIVLYKLWTNKAKLTAQKILIAAVISMFVSIIQLPILGFNPPNVERSLFNINICIDTMTRFNYLIGDSIVVWRAWVLWTNHRRVHMLLCICLFGTFVGVTADLAFVILSDSPQFSANPRFSSTILRSLILMLPLFLTNFIATILIAYKVWEYKAEIKQNLGLSKNRRTNIERVLILLTESGSIYCLLWLSILAFGLKSLWQVMYPITIILLLALEKANLESTVSGPSFSQSLQFASRPHIPTVTRSHEIAPDSTTGYVDSVMSDSGTDDRPDSATDDRLDPTIDNRQDSNTNAIAVAEPLGARMEKHSLNHSG
ncbi:hypothetical protein C8J56DRAFT_1024380 [Mycena floridula]|nr:hypothetical protein C8J56DRAFT_1024380 [Mycena floridula]